MNEQKIAEDLKRIQEVAGKDKSIDIASLAIAALKQERGKQLTDKQRRWAFIISLGVPPVGLFFAAKYYFGDTEDGKDVAIICFVLTCVSIILFYILLTSSFSGSSLKDVQNISPDDLKSLVE